MTTFKVFDNIYKNKKWGSNIDESKNITLSGGASTIEINKYRIKFLRDFINSNNITNLYDICGDCNWQYEIIKGNNNINYYGYDVSKIALEKAKSKNKDNNNMYFNDEPIDLSLTVLECDYPDNSLIIIKEVIQHLPLENGIKMLQNIKKSGIKYIAITNYDIDIYKNRKPIATHERPPILNPQNINTDIGGDKMDGGGYYYNNLFLEPFNFTNPITNVNDIIDDYKYIRMYGNLIIFNIQEQSI